MINNIDDIKEARLLLSQIEFLYINLCYADDEKKVQLINAIDLKICRCVIILGGTNGKL